MLADTSFQEESMSCGGIANANGFTQEFFVQKPFLCTAIELLPTAVLSDVHGTETVACLGTRYKQCVALYFMFANYRCLNICGACGITHTCCTAEPELASVLSSPRRTMRG